MRREGAKGGRRTGAAQTGPGPGAQGRARRAKAKPERAARRKRDAPGAAEAPRRSRKVDAAARRAVILKAALAVFAERGYEPARLDDVARRAGVAKGTLYLYFDDKEKLFEEVVRSAASPVIERLAALTSADVPLAAALDTLYGVFETQVLGTERKLLLRLIIAEGPRFPRIAELYYQNVIARVLPLIRAMAERAHARGELGSDVLRRFPQLVAAPLLIAVVWDGLFARFAPLDVAGLLSAQRECLTGTPSTLPRRTRP